MEENYYNEKIVPLNIVMTYPVRWNTYKILRDFIQNFYDSVGFRQWSQRFIYNYEESSRKLTLCIQGITFSYEWLMHIGASTKTGNSDKYAGYFGEGFKIASLCALRDQHWNITMESGSWSLQVITIDQKIDTQTVQTLAYKIHDVEIIDKSVLALSGLTQTDFELFKTVLLSFYYPENPLFGEMLWEGKQGAVYTRSKVPIPKLLPSTRDFDPKGAVYCGYQMLGTNPFNLVVCHHSFKKMDRERNSLYTFDVIDVFKDVAYYISPQGAYSMLVKMRRYWNSTPQRYIDIHSWYPVINNLIYSLSQSPQETERFRIEFSNLLYLKRIFTVSELNRRRQARSWLSQQSESYILVQETFKKLGFPSLEDICEENNGFVVDEDQLDSRQQQCFEILETICSKIFDGFFLFDNSYPNRKLITNDKAAYHGMAVVHKKKNKTINNRGIAVRYSVSDIYLKREILAPLGYYDAMATYVHELCHMFGSDSSASFSLGLSFAMESLMMGSEIIQDGFKSWVMIFTKS